MVNLKYMSNPQVRCHFFKYAPLYLTFLTADSRTKAPGCHKPSPWPVFEHCPFVCQEKFEQALELSNKGLAIHRRVLGETHPDTLVDSYNLINLLGAMGKQDEAVAMCQAELQKCRWRTWHVRRRNAMDSLRLGSCILRLP